MCTCVTLVRPLNIPHAGLDALAAHLAGHGCAERAAAEDGHALGLLQVRGAHGVGWDSTSVDVWEMGLLLPSELKKAEDLQD